MSCPYFMPTEEFREWAWHARPRLPLGEPWRGECTAPGHEGERPSDDEIKQFCSFGYALRCPRLPAQRHADKIAFSLARDKEGIVLLYFVQEIDHTPGEHGTLQYDSQQGRWLKPHQDARVQRQAECYLASYLRRKEEPVRPGHPSS